MLRMHACERQPARHVAKQKAQRARLWTLTPTMKQAGDSPSGRPPSASSEKRGSRPRSASKKSSKVAPLGGSTHGEIGPLNTNSDEAAQGAALLDEAMASFRRPASRAPAPKPAPETSASDATPTLAANLHDLWTAAGWLRAVDVEGMLAHAFLGEGFETGGDELEAMRKLGRSDNLEEVLQARVVAAAPMIAKGLAPR